MPFLLFQVYLFSLCRDGTYFHPFLVDYFHPRQEGCIPDGFVDRFMEHLLDIARLALNEEKSNQKQDVSIQINPSEYINDMGGNGCYLKNTTQASVWSEEDEDYLKAAIWYAENPAPKVAKNAMLVEWLKNLRVIVQPQHKQEWSEADENRLSDAVFFVREYQIPTRDKRLLNAAKEAEEWLKSLKDRYTWKPSELQLECLDDAIKDYQAKGFRPVILMELLEELKKL